VHYEYAFVRSAFEKSNTGYHDRIREHAQEGWRLVQVLVERPAVGASDYVLIFERPIQ